MNRYDYEKVDVNNNDLVNIIIKIRDNYIDNFVITLKQTINLFKTADGFNCSDIFRYNILPEVNSLNDNTIIMNIYELLDKIIKQDKNEDEDDIIIKNLDAWSSLLTNICLLLFNIKTNNSIIYLSEIIEYRSIFHNISKFIKNRNKDTYFYLKKLNPNGIYTEVKLNSYTNSTNNDYIIKTVFPEIAEEIGDNILNDLFNEIFENPNDKTIRDTIHSKEICKILNIKYLELNESIEYNFSDIITRKINEFKEQFTTSLQTIFNSIDKNILYMEKLTIKKQQLLSFLDNILKNLEKSNSITTENIYSYIYLATNFNKLYYLLSYDIEDDITPIVDNSIIINKFCILLKDINYILRYAINKFNTKDEQIFYEIYWPQIIGCAKKHDKNTILNDIIELEIHDIENQVSQNNIAKTIHEIGNELINEVNNGLIIIQQLSGGNNKYKKTDKQITVIYKKKEYTRVIYICERKKYVKINKTFMLLSKLKKV